jgi:dephospho-CoA kinase
MIIGLSGYAGTGKDTVAKVLIEVDTPLTRGKKTSEIKSMFI